MELRSLSRGVLIAGIFTVAACTLDKPGMIAPKPRASVHLSGANIHVHDLPAGFIERTRVLIPGLLTEKGQCSYSTPAMTEDDNYAQVVESNSGCNVIFAIGKIASPHATGMLMIYPSFLMSSHREVTYTAGFKRDAVTMYAVINKLAWNYDGTHVSGGVPTISSPVITSPWTLGGQSSTF